MKEQIKSGKSTVRNFRFILPDLTMKTIIALRMTASLSEKRIKRHRYHKLEKTRFLNYSEWYGDGNSSKRFPLSLQYTVIRPLKDNLLHSKGTPLANLSDTGEDRKQKPLKHDKPEVFTATAMQTRATKLVLNCQGSAYLIHGGTNNSANG